MKKTLFKLSFGYDSKCTDAEMLILQKYYPDFKFKLKSDFGVPSYYKKDKKYEDWLDEDFKLFQEDEYDEYLKSSPRSFDKHLTDDYIDLDAFLKEDLNVKFEVIGRKEITFTQPEHELGISEYIKLFKTLERLSIQLENTDTFSSHCDVHMSGNPLWQINDLMLCEDFCTDALQERLNEGWRILACCVQAQRRPDYILGRYNNNYTTDRMAKRG